MAGINLLKEKVGIVLKKRALPHIVCEVKFALDISGSMSRLYDNGTVQNLTDRLLAIASKFDDNGEMEVWTFTNSFDSAPTITESMHEGYVNKHIINNDEIYKWGGTSYSPVMRDILNQSFFTEQVVEAQPAPVSAPAKASGFFGKVSGLFGKSEPVVRRSAPETILIQKDTKYPVFVPFVTDGDTNDYRETEELIKESAKYNIYWMMIGIGTERFKFLQEMADKYGNVGFLKINNLESISDDDFYMELLNEEFCGWVKKFAV